MHTAQHSTCIHKFVCIARFAQTIDDQVQGLDRLSLDADSDEEVLEMETPLATRVRALSEALEEAGAMSFEAVTTDEAQPQAASELAPLANGHQEQSQPMPALSKEALDAVASRVQEEAGGGSSSRQGTARSGLEQTAGSESEREWMQRRQAARRAQIEAEVKARREAAQRQADGVLRQQADAIHQEAAALPNSVGTPRNVATDVTDPGLRAQTPAVEEMVGADGNVQSLPEMEEGSGQLVSEATAEMESEIGAAGGSSTTHKEPPGEEPLGEARVAEAQVDEAQIDQALVDEAQVDAAQVDQALVDEAQVDEAQVDEAPTDQVPVDMAPEGHTPLNEAQADEAPADDARPDDSPSSADPLAADDQRQRRSSLPALPKGRAVWYENRDRGENLPATVIDVHYDDHPPYYTIQFMNGDVRETTRSHLRERDDEAAEVGNLLEVEAQSFAGAVGPTTAASAPPTLALSQQADSAASANTPASSKDNSSCDCQGPLWKVKVGRDGVMHRKIERRWALLFGGELLYFQDESCTALKRRLPMQGVRVLGWGSLDNADVEARRDSNPPVVRHFLTQRKFPIILQWPDYRQRPLDLVLATASRSEYDAWLSALRGAAADKTPVQQGWLHKAGGAKNSFDAGKWRRRWFVVMPARHELAYYEEQTSDHALGIIDLRGAELRATSVPSKPSESAASLADRAFRFQLITQSDEGGGDGGDEVLRGSRTSKKGSITRLLEKVSAKRKIVYSSVAALQTWEPLSCLHCAFFTSESFVAGWPASRKRSLPSGLPHSACTSPTSTRS